jgi:hypothetical protein
MNVETKQFIKLDKQGYWNYEFKSIIQNSENTVGHGFFPIGKVDFSELCDLWDLPPESETGFNKGFIRLPTMLEKC